MMNITKIAGSTGINLIVGLPAANVSETHPCRFIIFRRIRFISSNDILGYFQLSDYTPDRIIKY